jgi:hypothetical protein|uniref:Excisionase n=1 Tax=virus sp. ctmTa7 TaxID=2828255 RepID=A0A8S5RCD2_9VIRU|nr:MAG TPA: excisionase [virus sp. ctmTa7]DAU18396.1 MAG TPA: excisionase [Bacteriophage sp.]
MIELADLEVQQEKNNLIEQKKFLSLNDLYDVLPFGKTKILKLIAANELPVMKVGKDYITTYNILEKWVEEHIGDEIYFE